MIGDFYDEKWNPYKKLIPYVPTPNPFDTPTTLPIPPFVLPTTNIPEISKEEFEALKKEVAEMKELLRRAKAYDEKHGEPDCEIDEKLETLRKIAALVGIDLDDVLKSKPQNK